MGNFGRFWAILDFGFWSNWLSVSFRTHYLCYSATRFGEILPPWQKFESILLFLRVYLNKFENISLFLGVFWMCQNYDATLSTKLLLLGQFYLSSIGLYWANDLAIWSHIGYVAHVNRVTLWGCNGCFESYFDIVMVL